MHCLNQHLKTLVIGSTARSYLTKRRLAQQLPINSTAAANQQNPKQKSKTQLLKSNSNLQNIQVANYRRNNFCQPINWARRRGGGWDDHITADNKEFLDELIVDKYQLDKSESPLKESPWPKGQFNPDGVNKRIGVLAVKLGSMPQWTKQGKKIYMTLLQVCDNHVIDYIPPNIYMEKDKDNRSKDGQLGMAIVGSISADPRLFTTHYLNLFNNSGVPPKRKLTKFMVTPNAAVQPGTPLTAQHFRIGDYIDIGANTIGFGFQGVMKRWGMKGGPRSHGATKFHRKRGTIGSGRDRRPIKGIKMAGRMGCKWRQLKGLRIWRINTKFNILYVQGPTIPGPTHSYVRVVDSCLPKHREQVTQETHPPFPTHFKGQEENEKDIGATATADEQQQGNVLKDAIDNELHNFAKPTIRFEDFEAKTITKRDGAKIARIKG